MICEVRCLWFCQCWAGYKLQKEKWGWGGCRNTTLHLDLSAGFKKQRVPYLLCQKIPNLFDSQFVSCIFSVDDYVEYDMKTRVLIDHTSLGRGFLLKKGLGRGGMSSHWTDGPIGIQRQQ